MLFQKNKGNVFFVVWFLFSLQSQISSESSFEMKFGTSISDSNPEFLSRYVKDDFLAGGDFALGFGAINKKATQKYYPSVFNPLAFNYTYQNRNLHLQAGIENLGINSLNFSGVKSKFAYETIGFFQGEGTIESKSTNTNYNGAVGITINNLTISGSLSLRNFRSEYDKKTTLYSPGFLGIVNANSNYSTSALFLGLSFIKHLDNGKLILSLYHIPKDQGQISSSGKIEQTGVIRFPVDFLTGNFSNELVVANFLYGEKKPQIYGTRIFLDYHRPLFSNLSLSICLDYDRLYVFYQNFSAPTFFQFASTNPTSGNSRSESAVAYAEILSSYLLYREPILNEIRSLRLSLVISF